MDFFKQFKAELREASGKLNRKLAILLTEPSDEEVALNLKLIPPHFVNPNAVLEAGSDAPSQFIDPWPGTTTTTIGASPLQFIRTAGQTLQSTAASGTESRTMRDPNKGNLTFTMTLTVRTTVNLQVMGNTPWWLQTTLNNFTQNGNFGIFSATNQTLQIQSVPCTNTSTYTAVHNSPATNTTNFRWCGVFSDGATIN